MKLSLDRNNLAERKNQPENYIFFSVRDGKFEQMKFFISKYFSQKNFHVNVDSDSKCIVVDLYKDNEREIFLARSYVWLKDIPKENSFHNNFSNFIFDVKSYAVTSHIGKRTPNIVQNFWDEMQTLIDSGYFEENIKEVNYPFSNLKRKNINEKTALISIPNDFIKTALDSGYSIGKKTTLYEIELFFAEHGFLVEGIVNDKNYSLKLINTKKGSWDSAAFSIEFTEFVEKSTWHNDIYFGKSHIKNIFLNEPNGKVTKHYLNFKDLVQSDEFYNMIENSLKRKFYPFREHTYTGC